MKLRYAGEPSAYWSQNDHGDRIFAAAQREIAGSGCDEAYYRRLTGIRLFASMLAGDMVQGK
jgi:hypothetical protein